MKIKSTLYYLLIAFSPLISISQVGQDIGLKIGNYPNNSISFGDNSFVELFINEKNENTAVIFDSNGKHVKNQKLDANFNTYVDSEKEFTLIGEYNPDHFCFKFEYGLITITQTSKDLKQIKTKLKEKSLIGADYLYCFFNNKGNPSWAYAQINKNDESSLQYILVEYDVTTHEISIKENIISTNTLNLFDEHSEVFFAGYLGGEAVYGTAKGMKTANNYQISLFKIDENKINIIKTIEDKVDKGFTYKTLGVKQVSNDNNKVRFSISLTEDLIGKAHLKIDRSLGYKIYEFDGAEIHSMEFWFPKGMKTNDYLFIQLCHFELENQSYYYTVPILISSDAGADYMSIVYEYEAMEIESVKNISSTFLWQANPIFFSCFDKYFDSNSMERNTSVLNVYGDAVRIYKNALMKSKSGNIFVENIEVAM